MSDLQYRTKIGDTVDRICWHVYGRTDGVLEQVLEANPGLAAYGALLPVGVLVNLPEIKQPEAESQVGLW